MVFFFWSELKRRLKAEKQAQKKAEKMAELEAQGKAPAAPKDKAPDEEDIDPTVSGDWHNVSTWYFLFLCAREPQGQRHLWIMTLISGLNFFAIIY